MVGNIIFHLVLYLIKVRSNEIIERRFVRTWVFKRLFKKKNSSFDHFFSFLLFTISSSFIKMNLFFNKVLFLEDKCFFH